MSSCHRFTSPRNIQPQNTMAPKSRPIKNIGASQFLERFAIILDTPEIKTFQWSVDGKSVVIDSRHYEDEISYYDELSILKKCGSVDALRRFLCSHGFKRIARRSRAEVHEFQHPNLSIKGVNTKSRHKRTKCLDSLGPGTQQGVPSKTSKRKELLNICAASSSDLLFPPEKKRNARRLYQYINYALPGSHDQLLQDVLASTSCESTVSPAQLDAEEDGALSVNHCTQN